MKSLLQGRFINHPLHPILVHLPIGLWVASFLFDVGFFWSANSLWAQCAFLCISVGLIGAVLAAITGLADSIEIPKHSLPRRIATSHMVINLIITAFFSIGLYLRFRMTGHIPTLVTRGQFILSFFSIFLLSISGYLGGLLVYNYGLGFRPQLRGKAKDDIRRAA